MAAKRGFTLIVKLIFSLAMIVASPHIRAEDHSDDAIKSESANYQNQLVGSWTLSSGKYLNDKGKWINYQDLNLSAIKVISQNYFSFTTMQTSSGVKTFWAAGTGKYQLTQQHYTEFPSLNSFNVKEGESFTFSYKLIGNEWHTERFEAGVLSEVEVWKKLD